MHEVDVLEISCLCSWNTVLGSSFLKLLKFPRRPKTKAKKGHRQRPTHRKAATVPEKEPLGIDDEEESGVHLEVIQMDSDSEDRQTKAEKWHEKRGETNERRRSKEIDNDPNMIVFSRQIVGPLKVPKLTR